jgi:hypothetical protein
VGCRRTLHELVSIQLRMRKAIVSSLRHTALIVCVIPVVPVLPRSLTQILPNMFKQAVLLLLCILTAQAGELKIDITSKPDDCSVVAKNGDKVGIYESLICVYSI